MRQRTYRKTWRPGDRGFNFALIAVFVWFSLWLTITVGAFVVALHFILKYW